MATAEMKFTKGALDDAAHTGGQATRYRDPRYPNLYLEVGARSKTWRFRKFWKGQNFTETLGTWPQMTVIEAAQEAAVRSDGIEEKGVLIKDAGPRNAPHITLRLALEQHVTQALDPRQRKVSAETVLFRSFESNTRHQADRIWQRYTVTSSSGMRFASRRPAA